MRYTNKFSTSSMMEYEIFKARASPAGGCGRSSSRCRMIAARSAGIFRQSRRAHQQTPVWAADEDSMRYGDVRTFDLRSRSGCERLFRHGQAITLLPEQMSSSVHQRRAPKNPIDRIPLEQVT